MNANQNLQANLASHSGKWRLDELAPSRYALKVGEIEVLIVSDGVLPLPTTMLGHNADPSARAAWLRDMFLPPDAFDWALNAVVARSGGQTILIDAGLGADPDLHLPRAGQLVKRLDAAGVDLTSVTDLVLTHMHMDHIGGLLVDGVKEQLRPDLEYRCRRRRSRVLGSAGFFPDGDAAWLPGCAAQGRQAFRQPVPQSTSPLRRAA